MASVFISYSRTDQSFVRALYDALAASGRDAWVDWEGIPPSAEWLKEIYAGIDGADTFIFVLSPDSLASETCRLEAAHAVESRKRIIPLVCREVSAPQVRAINPLAPLADINWIFVRESDDFEKAFEQLRFALDTDLDYWHLSSDLLVRAKKWVDGAKNANLTLHGPELVTAERWQTQGADKEPRPTALQLEYINASRKATNLRQRRLLAAISVALAITVGLSTVSTLLYRVTLGQKQQLGVQNQQLAIQALEGQSSSDILANHIDQGLLLGVEATRRSDSFAARSALVNGLEHVPYLDGILHDDRASSTLNSGATLAFSHDGQTMMSTDFTTGLITLWDTRARRPRLHIQAGFSFPKAALSPSGRVVAAPARNGALTFWDTRTGSQRMTVSGVYPTSVAIGDAQPLVFSPNGQVLASMDPNPEGLGAQIDLLDAATGQVRQQLPLDFSPVEAKLAFSPDGQQLAASMGDCSDFACTIISSEVVVWALATRATTLVYRVTSGSSPYRNMYADLAYSPDGRTLMLDGCFNAACQGPTVRFWNVASRSFNPGGLTITSGGPSADFALLALSPDGHRLVTQASRNTLQLWDLPSQRPIGSPFGLVEVLLAFAFSPDGQHVVSMSDNGQLLIWRLTPFTPFGIPFDIRIGNIVSPSVLTPDGRLIVNGDDSGDVVMWDVATGRQVGLLPHAALTGISSLAISPDDHLLAVGDKQGAIMLWDLATRQRLAELQVPNVEPQAQGLNSIDELAFSADAQYLVGLSADATTAAVWDVVTRLWLHVYTTASFAVAFSAHGDFFAVSDGADVDIYAATSAWPLKAHLHGSPTSSTILAVAFSANGQTLASLTDSGRLQLWQVSTGRLIRTISNNPVSLPLLDPSLTFSRSNTGDELLVESAGNDIVLWNTQTGTLLAPPISDPQGVLGTTFSPDGQLLVETEVGGTVIVRYVTEMGWQMAACHIANRNLTKAEWAQFFPGEPYEKTCPDLPAGL